MNSPTRREALVIIAGAAKAHAQHRHADEAATPSAKDAPYKPKTLTASEMELVAKLSDLMIPRTETPGASDAGVPEYIDRHLEHSPDTAIFRRGLAEFAALPDERRLARMTEISNEAGNPFFRMLKDLTIEGYYSSRAGLVEELGWHGNTFLSEFKGCTHPEHQS
jgi:hypothetical protein